MDGMCACACMWNSNIEESTEAGLITDDYMVLKLDHSEGRKKPRVDLEKEYYFRAM